MKRRRPLTRHFREGTIRPPLLDLELILGNRVETLKPFSE
jgi:hypothetical protein